MLVKEFISKGARRRALKILAWTLTLGVSACYLVSKKETPKSSKPSQRDLDVAADIRGLMDHTQPLIHDFSRFNQYLLGSILPAESVNLFTDTPEYTALFMPSEPEPVVWQKGDKPEGEESGDAGEQGDGKAEGDGRRFRTEIWNESIYLYRRLRPDFRLRAEGRVGEDGKLDALVLAVDSGKEISGKNSLTIFSSRKKCDAQRDCTSSLNLDLKSAVRALGLGREDQFGWTKSSGVLKAAVSGKFTKVDLENYRVATSEIEVVYSRFQYSHEVGTNSSPVAATCRVAISQEKFVRLRQGFAEEIRSLLPENPKESLVLEISAQGDVRNPGSLEFSYRKVARQGEQH